MLKLRTPKLDTLLTNLNVISRSHSHCSQIQQPYTAQKMKFSIKDFFSKYDQIRRKL